MLPLEIILNIIVAIGFTIFWTATFVILYHLTRFGIGTQPKKFAAIFLFGSVALFCGSIILYVNIDFATLI